MPQLDRKIHCSLYNLQYSRSWKLPCPDWLCFPSPSAQFVSCPFRRCSCSVVIPSHLPNYLRLPRLHPVSPFSQLPFQGCHNPWPFNLTLPNSHSCLLLHFIPQQELFNFLSFRSSREPHENSAAFCFCVPKLSSSLPLEPQTTGSLKRKLKPPLPIQACLF